MCKWGTDRLIYVIRRNNPGVPDGWHPVYMDACIAGYVQRMNDRGIITTACCCGHGKGPGSVLVATESVPLLDKLGYEYHPYGNRDDVVEHSLPVCGIVRMAVRDGAERDKPLTKELIDVIRARAEAAAGPKVVTIEEDAEFFAHARQDVSALLAHINMLEAEIKEMLDIAWRLERDR